MDTVPDSLRLEFDQFWKHVYNAGAVLKTIADQLRVLRETNRKLDSQIVELAQRLHHRDEQLTSSIERIEQLEVALDEAQSQLRRANETIEQLRQQNERLGMLELVAEQERERAQQLQSELAALQQLYEQLTDDYRALSEQATALAELERDRDNLRARIAELEHHHLRTIADREELEHLRSLVEQYRLQAESSAEQSRELRNLAERLEERDKSIEILQEELAVAQQTIGLLQDELTAKQAELAWLGQRLEHAENALAKAHDSDSIEHWRQQMEDELRRRQAAFEKLSDDYRQLTAECDTLRSAAEQWRHEAERLRQENERLLQESEHRRLDTIEPSGGKSDNEEVQRLERELQLSEHAASQQQQQLAELSAEVTRLRDLLQQYQMNERSTEERIADAIGPFQIKLSAAEHELKHLQQQITAQRQRIHQLEDELRGELERNIVLKRRIRQLESQPTMSHTSSLVEQLSRIVETLRTRPEDSTLGAEIESTAMVLVEKIEQVLAAHRQWMLGEELLEAISNSRRMLEQYLRQ